MSVLKNRANVKVAGRIFDLCNLMILSIIGLITILPFYHVIVTSLAIESDILRSPILLFPSKITFDAYRYIFNDELMVRSFLNSVGITIVGTIYSLFLIVTCAYVLSKSHVKGIKGIFVYILITLYFTGGLIPEYILIKNLGMSNQYSALIIPQGFNIFYMFVVLGYLRGNPESLEEAAKIDGANDILILIKIVVPISMPVIMTISLFLIVDKWNDWFPAMLYLKDSDKFPISYLLRTIIINMNQTVLKIGQTEIDRFKNAYPEAIQKAAIIFTMAPIMIIYPFVQKHFAKGIMIGAVKG